MMRIFARFLQVLLGSRMCCDYLSVWISCNGEWLSSGELGM